MRTAGYSQQALEAAFDLIHGAELPISAKRIADELVLHASQVCCILSDLRAAKRIRIAGIAEDSPTGRPPRLYDTRVELGDVEMVPYKPQAPTLLLDRIRLALEAMHVADTFTARTLAVGSPNRVAKGLRALLAAREVRVAGWMPGRGRRRPIYDRQVDLPNVAEPLPRTKAQIAAENPARAELQRQRKNEQQRIARAEVIRLPRPAFDPKTAINWRAPNVERRTG